MHTWQAIAMQWGRVLAPWSLIIYCCFANTQQQLARFDLLWKQPFQSFFRAFFFNFSEFWRQIFVNFCNFRARKAQKVPFFTHFSSFSSSNLSIFGAKIWPFFAPNLPLWRLNFPNFPNFGAKKVQKWPKFVHFPNFASAVLHKYKALGPNLVPNWAIFC